MSSFHTEKLIHNRTGRLTIVVVNKVGATCLQVHAHRWQIAFCRDQNRIPVRTEHTHNPKAPFFSLSFFSAVLFFCNFFSFARFSLENFVMRKFDLLKGLAMECLRPS